MKMFPDRPRSAPPSLLRTFCWLVLVGASSAQTHGQSSALIESTKAFYRGDYLEAAQLAEKHLRAYPKDVPVRLVLARAELAQGKFHQAFEGLQNILVSDPNNIDALYYVSLIARELSHREYERLFSIAPDSGRVHQLLGEAALAAENRSEAEEEFQKALSSNPHSIEVSAELAELKRSQSKFDEAITYYTQAEQNGQFEAAIQELNVSIKIEPRMKQAYFLLGRAYSKLGRMDDAKVALKKLDELNRSEIPGQRKSSSSDAHPKPDTPRPD